jgi:Aerobic-type carbon monoxide dehydrogenase, small subunit CoxS/CutS homologs
MARILQFTLNGRARSDAISENILLLDYLREFVGLTGTKTGCDGGECGACTVLVDDQPRLSCLTLAASVDGRRVDTVESLMSGGRLSAVQRGFHEKLGSQCGYCTPGFIMASAGLLRRNPRPTDDEIREALGSNICRCTGYVKIIEAVKYAADLHAAEPRHERDRADAYDRRLRAAGGRAGKGFRARQIHRGFVGLGMLAGRIFRSPYSHAEILDVDVSEAEKLPGVKAIVTGADCDKGFGVLPIARTEHPLARERVRYCGEPVAAVPRSTTRPPRKRSSASS